MPQLVDKYGSAAASLAADFYDAIREASADATGDFTAFAADTAPTEAVQVSTRWGLGGVFQQTPDLTAALGALSGVLDRFVKQAARDTVDQSVNRDPARPLYARIPEGKDTCSFCLMVASRGAVYGSSKDAGGDGNKYHANCDCVPVPVWGPGDMRALKEKSGYNPDELLEQYAAVHEPGMSAAQTTQAWRAKYGD